jgi:hypothetical protein
MPSKMYCMEAKAKLRIAKLNPKMTLCLDSEGKMTVTASDCDWTMKSLWICFRVLLAGLQARRFP